MSTSGKSRSPARSVAGAEREADVSAPRRWADPGFLQSQGLLLILAGLMLFFSLKSPFFWATSNLLNVAASSTVLAIMAAPQTFLIVSGGFDVSVGATIAISTVSLGLLLAAGVPMAAAIVVVLFIGLAVGAANATLVVHLRVNPLIATLGTMSIFTGLAHFLSSGQTEVVRNDFLRWITKTQVGPVSVLVFMFIAVYVISIVLERTTVLGRWFYAIGGNAEAARLAGLPIRRVQYSLYIASGLSASVGGVLLTGILQSASPRVGDTFLLSVVTAVILGGASLTGGRGSIIGTLLAVAILGVLQNGFSLLLLPSSVQTIALGIALIVAVVFDGMLRRIERRP